jgi:hypothetical protein
MRKWRNMASPAPIISAETGAARGAGDGPLFWANPQGFLPVQFASCRSLQEIAIASAFSHCLPPRFPFTVNIALWLQDTVSEWFFSQSFARYKMRRAATENGS